jgi:hypothetical protein
VTAARSASGRDLVVRALIIGTACRSHLLLQRGGIDVVQWIAQIRAINPAARSAITCSSAVTWRWRSAHGDGRWRSYWAWGALAALQAAALVASGSRGRLWRWWPQEWRCGESRRDA